ncbi:MAG: SDR family oxidoreductase [Myxococcota bacterium]
MSADHLSDRLCVITGASSGIGAAIGRALATRGAAVLGLARRFAERPLDAAPQPGEIVERQLDVTDEARVAVRFAELGRVLAERDDGRGLDILINAAGWGSFAPFSEIAVSDLRSMLDVHIVGTFSCARAALDLMVPRGRGHIINIGSLAAIRVFGQCAAYSAAKAGQLALARVLAEEARPHGVRVTSVHAGAVDTAIWDLRPGFDRAAMMRPESFAELIADIAARPEVAVDEVVITPPAGAL